MYPLPENTHFKNLVRGDLSDMDPVIGRDRLVSKITELVVVGFRVCIRGYRYWVSPWIGPCCRFEPTCSHFAEQAIYRHGPFKGILLATRRILKCHPFHPGGLDQVP